jgi:nucleoside-diphosphate-sugar epimerase
MHRPLIADLDLVLAQTEGVWEELRGQRLFITGGTGFFGCWLLESLLWANARLNLRSSAVVLTRDPEAFRRKAPHLAGDPAIALLPGDVRTFAYPAGTFSHIIHAAAETHSASRARGSLALFEGIVQGTRRTLDFAHACGAGKFLFVSSGAVYGKPPAGVAQLAEEDPGAPATTDPRSAYGEGKRAAEMLCTLYGDEFGFKALIARCFAFVGPYQPLDSALAIMSFMRDGLQGGPIRVMSDGTACRSYLYAADLAIWLWTVLAKGMPGRPYNVGSEEAITIRHTALLVADAFSPPVTVQIEGTTGATDARASYVPATTRAQTELGLRQNVMLPDAIRRTLAFIHNHGVS